MRDTRHTDLGCHRDGKGWVFAEGGRSKIVVYSFAVWAAISHSYRYDAMHSYDHPTKLTSLYRSGSDHGFTLQTHDWIFESQKVPSHWFFINCKIDRSNTLHLSVNSTRQKHVISRTTTLFFHKHTQIHLFAFLKLYREFRHESVRQVTFIQSSTLKITGNHDSEQIIWKYLKDIVIVFKDFEIQSLK